MSYCFTVDQDNKDFNFLYALVFEDFNHLPEIQPFFQWTLYKNDNNLPNPNNIIDFEKIIAAQTDPFFLHHPGEFLGTIIDYKGWTCKNYDLTPFIGTQLCIEFIVADCSGGEHFGYAYIDGLCSQTEDLVPDIEIRANDVYCNQIIEITTDGSGYNQYQWTISKLDGLGNPYESVTSPKIVGYKAYIADLGAYYEELSHNEVKCDDKLLVELTVFSDCTTFHTSKEIQLSCSEYTIDYCDIIYDCLDDPQERIIGVNDCNDCDIAWFPNQYLILDDIKFPIVTAENYANAFDQTYVVRVISPEGCIWYESIGFEHDIEYTISFENTLDYCDGVLDIIITFDDEIDNSQYEFKAMNVLTNTPYELLYPEFINNASNGTVKVYRLHYERDKDIKVKVQVEITPQNQECHTDDPCIKIAESEIIPKSVFIDPWHAYIPLWFQPDQEENNTWAPLVAGVEFDNCEDVTPTPLYNSHIYYEEVTVWDGDFSNGIVWHKVAQVDPSSNTGVHPEDIVWHGNWTNGKPAASGTYPVVLEIRSCYPINGIAPCTLSWDCELDWDQRFVCPEGNISTYSFDITMIR